MRFGAAAFAMPKSMDCVVSRQLLAKNSWRDAEETEGLIEWTNGRFFGLFAPQQPVGFRPFPSSLAARSPTGRRVLLFTVIS